jgi:aryl-phospho-beta-D-glucosidase BglC (GH1 family)
MAEWGANIIRLPIVPDNLHNHGMDETLRILDQTVAWASEYQMYVIIDFHSVGWPPTNYYHPSCACNETSKQEILDFWATISRHYADNDVVAFYELFNEPVTRAETQWYITGAPNEAEDWLAWKEFMEQVIAVIRVNDPEKIILVSGLQFAYDLEFVAEAPIADSNVAYATHPYANNSNLDWDTAFGNLSYRYPVIAAELGYEEPGNPDPDYNGIPYHQAIIDYFEAHHMSWTVWVFDATWDTSLLLDMQTYQPSLSGEYFRGRLLELNQRP